MVFVCFVVDPPLTPPPSPQRFREIPISPPVSDCDPDSDTDPDSEKQAENQWTLTAKKGQGPKGHKGRKGLQPEGRGKGTSARKADWTPTKGGAHTGRGSGEGGGRG